MTLVACEPGSRDQDMLAMLPEVATFRLEEDGAVLVLAADDGPEDFYRSQPPAAAAETIADDELLSRIALDPTQITLDTQGLFSSWQANAVAVTSFDQNDPPGPGLPDHIQINFDAADPVNQPTEDPIMFIIPVTALNAIPGVNIQIPGGQTYLELRDRVTALVTTVTDFRDMLQQRREATVAELTTLVTSHIRRINDAIESVRTPINQAQTLTTNTLKQIVYTRATLPRIITLAALGLTLVLLWTIISQIILFALAYSWWTGNDLLARWRPTPPIHESHLPPSSAVETPRLIKAMVTPLCLPQHLLQLRQGNQQRPALHCFLF